MLESVPPREPRWRVVLNPAEVNTSLSAARSAALSVTSTGRLGERRRRVACGGGGGGSVGHAAGAELEIVNMAQRQSLQ